MLKKRRIGMIEIFSKAEHRRVLNLVKSVATFPLKLLSTKKEGKEKHGVTSNNTTVQQPSVKSRSLS